MSEEAPLLLNPGPVPVAPEVREAMDAPAISHRSPAFEEIYERARDGLEYVFTRSTLDGSRTGDGTALLLNGTATMGMEAAVSNLVDPGEDVLALINGKFGRRFAAIAERYAEVRRLEVEWGDAFDLGAVEAALTDDTALVTMVHGETSTGLLNPVGEVGNLAAERGARFVVDAVTSVGGDVFRAGEWNVDVAVTDAQKALAAPPGISGLFVAAGAGDDLDGDRGPFYHDLERHLRLAEGRQTPFTSAVSLFRALAVALERIEAESMPERIRRHRARAAAFREAFEAMGLDPFAVPDPDDPTGLSNTVTVVSLPDALGEPDAFFEAVAERNVSISGGQAHLDGDVFRVSSMGDLDRGDLLRGVGAVAGALADCGVAVDREAGLAAAESRLD